MSQTAPDPVPALKRKRGRPRKLSLTAPEPVPALKSKRGRPRKLSFATALKEADEVKRSFQNLEEQQLHDQGEQAAKLVAAAYKLHEAGRSEPEEWNSWLRAEAVERLGDVSTEYVWTLQAMILPELRKKKRSRITYYAQACEAMRVKKVPAYRALEWIGSDDSQHGKGLQKCKRIYDDLPDVIMRRDAEKTSKVQAERKLVADAISQNKSLVDLEPLPGIPAGRTVVLLGDVSEDGRTHIRRMLTDDPLRISRFIKQVDRVRAAPERSAPRSKSDATPIGVDDPQSDRSEMPSSDDWRERCADRKVA